MKFMLLSLCSIISSIAFAQQPYYLSSCLYHTGKAIGFQDTLFDDQAWSQFDYQDDNISFHLTDTLYTRFHFKLLPDFFSASPRSDSFKIVLPALPAGAQFWLNGHRIYPRIMPDANVFRLSMILKYLNARGANLFAIAVFSKESISSLVSAPPFITMLPLIDAIDMEFQPGRDDQNQRNVLLSNRLGMKVEGRLYVEIKDMLKDTVLQTFNRNIVLAPYEFILHPAILRKYSPMQVTAVFTEKFSRLSKKIVVEAGH